VSRPVRFGLIRTEGAFRRWEAECLSRLTALPSVALAAVIVPVHSPAAKSGAAGQAWPSSWLIRRAQRGAWGPADASRHLSAAPELRCRVSEESAGRGIAGPDVSTIEAQNLDFLLAFGGERWSGKVLAAARWGLWAFRYTGQPGSPDAPPGFWEVCREERTTGAALVALSDHPAGDPILKHGLVSTAGRSYAANAATISLEAAAWPAQVCACVEAGSIGFEGRRRLPRAGTGPPVRSRDLPRLLLGTLRTRWRQFADRNLYADVWNVGVVRAPIERFLEPGYRPTVEWFPAPRAGTFRADPFGLTRNGRITVLFEEFDYREDLGRIAALELGKSAGYSSGAVTIGPPVHLSYPYVFELVGEVLCVPETYQAGEVGLYRADEFPTRWSKVATLIGGVPALDATVFKHGDRWWLACAMQGPTERSHLHLYHAPDLLGPWTPHLGNPVKVDIGSGRPGGTPFVHAGVLYRPAQDASGTYGGRVVINRVTRLTPVEFDEEPAAVVGPLLDSPYPDGLHTLSAAGGITLVDAKRVVLMTNPAVRAGLRPWLKQRLRHALTLATRIRRGRVVSPERSPELH
jgi:hypothetical protein